MLLRLCAIVLMLFPLSCSLLSPAESNKPAEPVPVITAEIPAPAPVSVVAPKPAAPPPEVAILVSSDIPAYREVADELAARLGSRARTWYLKGAAEGNKQIVADVARSNRPQVVAIGLDAALGTKGLRGRQVIFCQVFNYEDYRLPSSSTKGVGVLPSYGGTFEVWKGLSPELTQVAIVTGPRLKELVRQATLAAQAQGITVLHREVASDKEFQLVVKELADKVQGYWLWPDNRVLSGGVMREVMTFSVRSGKQVLVFNDDLLTLGGLISATSDARDIAGHVIARLQSAEGRRSVPGVALEPLDVVNLRINPVMAKRFGLEIPEQYRKYTHAP